MKNSSDAKIFTRLTDAIARDGRELGEVCSEAKIALSSIYRWKTGAAPRIKNVLALARVLNRNAKWLTTGDGPEFPPESEKIRQTLGQGPEGAFPKMNDADIEAWIGRCTVEALEETKRPGMRVMWQTQAELAIAELRRRKQISTP